ncbi:MULTISPECIES: LysR substrate-binding domain-containing protein [Rhodopseudomonas]|uniref:LysR family transcriptional regulator n=1 Tax=Rhodopseudomonas palustris TaxID=1076 RepID=A0A0D7ER05_RHOPL|nr:MULTISPECIES: LysR substrate-binding domain-containing protein [Rhodopseudomonas]KIZ42985.1 LysR family transcriptional regulator [Rhodopseudomonas palustris]MDF3811131.1 LysR substrate-binding domain-containing protein [Rhodopseudomonas sp. BAL398]WOK20821.1 LysR substrate-binding domain-containing protein [Rhodopseudomonas sp. BAL398]
MRFDLVDLRLFVAIAEARSITGGAARAHLALASASARIRGLEQSLGVALLTRGRRGVTLTAAGDSLLGHARLVLHDVEVMRGDLAAYARGLKASVHLLANTASLSEHLPKALAAFLAAHPDYDIDVEERESAEIAEAIAAGAAEVGIAVEAAVPAALERFGFCDDRLMLVLPPRDPLARRRTIAFGEVVGRDFVGLAGPSALQEHIAAQAARLGVRLRLRARLRDFGSVAHMVEAGVGVAVMPEAAARACARTMKVRAVRLSDGFARRKLVICVRSLKSLPRPAQLMVAHLRRSGLS